MRSKECICRCRSYCTTWNPATSSYEGEGKLVPRRTRDNHARDDKVHAARLKTSSITQKPHGPACLLPVLPTPRSQGLFTPDIARNVNSLNSPVHGQLKVLKREVAWYRNLPATSPITPLMFVNDPTAAGDFRWPSEAEILIPNNGLHALRAGHHSNLAFLATENRFCELITILRTMEQSDETATIIRQLFDELVRLTHEKELQWIQQGPAEAGKRLVNTGTRCLTTQTYSYSAILSEIHFYPHGPQDPTSKAASAVSLVLENIFFTSRRALSVNLAGMKDVMHTTCGGGEAASGIPKDPRSCASRFRLDPVVSQFVSCPTCHCLYPYTPGESLVGGHPAIMHCTFRQTPQNQQCGTALWKLQKISANQTMYTPRKKFLYQVLKHWIGRLVSRKGIEDYLDDFPAGPPSDPDGLIDDIWSSPVFQSLKDAAGNPFFPPPAGEGRLVFSLSVDGFNPYHTKAAGIQASTTGIWLVVLNLPPHLRYLSEHICPLGFIEDKPAVDQINHYLQLVVDDLKELWEPGIFVSRTYNYPSGRHFQGMLIPLVADMLAAHQAIGLASPTSHHFCTFCDLDIDDIDVLDPSEWPAKNADHIRCFATLWKESASERHQTQVFEAFGLRWSPLLELPYWDPVRYTVIDSMHALDLGLFHHHCRQFFIVDPTVTGGDGSASEPTFRRTAVPKQEDLDRCLGVIQKNETAMSFELLSFNRAVLFRICTDYNIVGKGHTLVVGTKWVLARNIYQWVSGVSVSLKLLRVSDDEPQRQGNSLDVQVLLGLSQYPPSETSHESESPPSPDSGKVVYMDPDIDMDASSMGEESSEGSGEESGEESSEEFELPRQEGIDLKSGVVQRVIRYLVAGTEEKQTKAYNQGTTAIFIHLCELLDIDHSVFQTRKKRHAFDAIRDLVCLFLYLYMISIVTMIYLDCLR